MSTSLFLLVFNICLLCTFIKLTVSNNEDPSIQLYVHPEHGFLTENIEVRCQIKTPSIYENIYLSVKTDNVKPSGILLMVDNRVNQCRINKEKFIHITVCNSTLIIIHIDHTILNDTLNTIDYSCSQGDDHVVNSYRILRQQPVQYKDMKSDNSSSTLTQTLSLILFLLLITRLTTTEDVR
ncbi:hypothetical protein I4U23_014836 [Adineta vaga]|nr:hypothetical protein I4U23_014836 [Adineta vaga]